MYIDNVLQPNAQSENQRILKALLREAKEGTLSFTKMLQQYDGQTIDKIAAVILGVRIAKQTQTISGDNPHLSQFVCRFKNAPGNKDTVMKVKVGRAPSGRLRRGIEQDEDIFHEFHQDEDGVYNVPLPWAFRVAKFLCAWKKTVPGKYVELPMNEPSTKVKK